MGPRHMDQSIINYTYSTKGVHTTVKTFLSYITRLIHFIAQPEYDVPVLCSIETQQKTHKRYFVDEKQRAHTGYEKSTFVWREHKGEPN
jgi:hypothetical protein